ncbi:MAG: response regulator [Candidatus Omnitrophica bacterium]|nr:response regulator [Candidatus Omnitrophota bacterium]
MGKGKKILIVEDDPDIAQATAKALEKLGFEPAGIFNKGEEAVEKVFAIRPDLVIMDVVLDGQISGIETSRHLEQFLNLPVVFVTGHRDIAAAMSANRRVALLKPFTVGDLQKAIEAAFTASSNKN